MKRVWKDFITYLPPIYGKLLLINFPNVFVIILYLLVKIILLLLWPHLIVLTPIFNFVFSFLYYWLLLPYLQGVLVLYIYNYLQRGNRSSFKIFKLALDKRWELRSLNMFCDFQSFFYFMLFSISLGLAFFTIYMIAKFLGIYIFWSGYFMRNLMFFLIPACGYIIIYYYIVFVFTSILVLTENRSVKDSFKISNRLTKNNKNRIVLGAFIIVMLSLFLMLIASIISGWARLIVVYLSYPLFWVYSTIVYKHLKLPTTKRSSKTII